jgi:hypothetical protein
MVAMGQTQVTQPKINTTLVSINGSDIKDALTSVHNNTTPHYVKLSENQIKEALMHLPGWSILDGKLQKNIYICRFFYFV